MLFYGLKGRRVVVNLDGGEALKGVVLRTGWFSASLTDVDVIDAAGQVGSMLGTARVSLSRVTWIQEL